MHFFVCPSTDADATDLRFRGVACGHRTRAIEGDA
jgi:hypothetical protein